MDETTPDRTFDPGRGEFCATTKQGNPLPFPPVKREPKNTRGIKRPGKTFEDSLPVDKRPRVEAANKRRAAMGKKGKSK